MTVNFTVTICGSGATKEECWNDAVSSFALDPGPPSEDDEVVEEDEEEDTIDIAGEIKVDFVYSRDLPITVEHNGEKYQLHYPLSLTSFDLNAEAAALIDAGHKIFIMEPLHNSGYMKQWIYKTIKEVQS